MTITTKTEVECSYCGDPLDLEESQSPRIDPDDDTPVCDECWHDKFEFTCCRCCEYGDVADQHNLLIVFEDIGKVIPGVYKVIDRPYYTHAMIGSGWLHEWALERIADLNPDMDGNGYPCGHLCLNCQSGLLAQFTGKCSVCKSESPGCLRVKFGSWKDFDAGKYQWTRAKAMCPKCRHEHRGAWKRIGGRSN
jgi:hypothetical protein